MAIINQSPAAQASASLAGLTIDNISASGTPLWQSLKIAGSPSVEFSRGSGQIELPTSGQIWPLGVFR